MQVTEGQIVTVEAGGERASYVVTDLNIDNFMTCGSHVNPREMKLLRLAEQPSDKPTDREKKLAALDILEECVDESGTRGVFGEVLDEIRGEVAANPGPRGATA